MSGRKPRLTDEQCFMILNDTKKQTLAAYARDFGVSYPTAFKVKKGQSPYDAPFSNKWETEMMKKYFPEKPVLETEDAE